MIVRRRPGYRGPKVGNFARLATLCLAWSVLCCFATACSGHISGASNGAHRIDAHAAVLGGSAEAFTAQFGSPVVADSIYEYSSANGQRVVLGITAVRASNGENRISRLLMQPRDGGVWDAKTAGEIYGPFLPPDAVPVGEVNGTSWTHRVFRSEALGATLPPEVFVDGQRRALPPGTLEIVCGAQLIAADSQFGCIMAAGAVAD